MMTFSAAEASAWIALFVEWAIPVASVSGAALAAFQASRGIRRVRDYARSPGKNDPPLS